MTKKIKISIILITMLGFLVTQALSYAVFKIADSPDKKIVILKTNKSVSKTNSILSKKRIKIYDDILCAIILFDFCQNSDKEVSVISKSVNIPQTAEYAVWSRSTFS